MLAERSVFFTCTVVLSFVDFSDEGNNVFYDLNVFLCLQFIVARITAGKF
jgi:hypothetical protein